MLSSSPLPPTVLNELIIQHPLLTNGHFRQVFVANTKLPEDVYDNLVAMDLPMFHKLIIYAADAVATYIPWMSWTGEIM